MRAAHPEPPPGDVTSRGGAPSRSILVVEDEPATRFTITRHLQKSGYEVRGAESVDGAIRAFQEDRPDAAVLDYSLPDGNGIALMGRMRAMEANLPVVMLTAHASVDLAVQAIQEGADHFLTKPVELPALTLLVARMLQNQRYRQDSRAGAERRRREVAFPFLGESEPIRHLAEEARRVLESTSPVLILGETGSGKGVLAGWLHREGRRSAEPFVDMNCAGLSREFLETELFGHEKGAFTGALAAKEGLLEIGHRGTVFLDEIGDVDLQVQPKLLKVVEDKRFRRLGDVRERQVDIRLITATHHDLPRAVAEGRFRGDLYYRISTLQLRVPPLRERQSDVIEIARELLRRIAAELGRSRVTLSGAAERAIVGYTWPGNVRELANVLERAVLRGGDELTGEDLVDGLDASSRPGGTVRITLREAERRHIQAVLAVEEGRVASAAAILGLSRSALYQKIRRHRLFKA